MKPLLAALIALTTATAASAGDCAPPFPAFGAEGHEQDRAREAVREGRQIPLTQVLRMIASRTPGRHLNTTQDFFAGRAAYFVQWQLPDGRVVIFIVDAESGNLLARQGG